MLPSSIKEALITSISSAFNRIADIITNRVGDLEELNTTDKSNVVAALNEVQSSAVDGIVTTTVVFVADTAAVLSTLVPGTILASVTTLVAGDKFISLATGNEMKIFEVQASGQPIVVETLSPKKTNVVIVTKLYSLTSPTSVSGTLLATPVGFVRLATDNGRGIFIRSLLPDNLTSVHLNNLVGGLLPTALSVAMPNRTLSFINTVGNGIVHMNRINLISGTAAEFGVDIDGIDSTDTLLATLIRTPATGSIHHWNFELFVNGQKLFKSIRGDVVDPNDNTLAVDPGWTNHRQELAAAVELLSPVNIPGTAVIDGDILNITDVAGFYFHYTDTGIPESLVGDETARAYLISRTVTTEVSGDFITVISQSLHNGNAQHINIYDPVEGWSGWSAHTGDKYNLITNSQNQILANKI